METLVKLEDFLVTWTCFFFNLFVHYVYHSSDLIVKNNA